MKASKGSARHNLLAFLPVLALFGYLGGMAYSQSADPCSLYPHQSAPIFAGTPTAIVVAGVANKGIAVCRVTLSEVSNPGTPGVVTFYKGGAAASTPCATGTAGGPNAVATVGAVASLAGTAPVGGDGNHTLWWIPASSGTPVVDLCAVMSLGTGMLGSVDFVYVKP